MARISLLLIVRADAIGISAAESIWGGVPPYAMPLLCEVVIPRIAMSESRSVESPDLHSTKSNARDAIRGITGSSFHEIKCPRCDPWNRWIIIPRNQMPKVRSVESPDLHSTKSNVRGAIRGIAGNAAVPPDLSDKWRVLPRHSLIVMVPMTSL